MLQEAPSQGTASTGTAPQETGLRLRKVVPFTTRGRVTIAQLSAELGLSAAQERFYSRFLGLDQVATAGELTVLDMLLSVGGQTLAGTDRSAIGYLIHAHTMQHVAPQSARLVGSLRDKLGLPGAKAFSLANQGCVSGLYALGVAQSLLRTEPAGTCALLLVGEKAGASDGRLIPGATLLGDGAVGVLLGLGGPGDAVLATSHRTLGEYHESRGMSRATQKEYQKVYVPMMETVLSEAAGRAGFSLADAAMILPHNVNRFSWIEVARRLDLPEDRIYLDNIARDGHCYGSDPFVNLEAARAVGRVAAGDHVLLVSAGQGATFTATAVRIGAAGSVDA